MTTPSDLRRDARWPALLLPLLAACGYVAFHGRLWWLLVLLAAVVAAVAPGLAARLAPFALAAYGGYGLILARSLAAGGQARQLVYGVTRLGPGASPAYVLPQALLFLAAGACLLAVTGAPGGRAVRRALAQLRGLDDEPRAVPPALLLPVIFLWEELFSQWLWPGPLRTLWWLPAVALLVAGAALVALLPRVAAVAAVLGTVVFGLAGLLFSLRIAVPASMPANWLTTTFYGALPLRDQFHEVMLPAYRVFTGAVAPGPRTGRVPGEGALVIAGQDGGLVLLLTAAQGIALLVLGGVLATRLTAGASRDEPPEQARALARRVTRLTETRRDATETAAAELRRIERNLHDGAQARLVAVGMSLRAAEQLMPGNPEAAMALVAEARETSSRALDDLRDLVRDIYPPVLADRGLGDAVRALALDAPLAVDTDITLPDEPPVPVAAAVYFSIAEALANAVRHADAGSVSIGIGYDGGTLRAVVADDGRGGADPAAGTGLSGIERRLAAFDGVLAVTSPAGGPTIIAVEVPCALARGAGWAAVVRSSWQTGTLI